MRCTRSRGSRGFQCLVCLPRPGERCRYPAHERVLMLEFSTREPCDKIKCPSCRHGIRFYRFGGMGEMFPHFYCNRCSNVLFRDSDGELLDNLIASHGLSDEEILNQISRSLPTCPCGGCFAAGQNPKCPSCKMEIVHGDDAVKRMRDPYAILIEGAQLVRDRKG